MTTRIRAERLQTSDGPRWYLDRTRWVDLPGLDPVLDAGLGAASGWAGTAPPPSDHHAAAVVALFDELGLVRRAPAGGTAAGTRVAVIGTGALARAVSRQLLRAGVRTVLVHDPSPAGHAPGRPSRQAVALVQALRPRHRVVVRPVGDLDDLSAAGVDLVVVATDTPEPDRLVLDGLVRLDLVHLVVACGQETGRIGPLVFPGRTPCSTCADLAASQADRAWPQVLSQLTVPGGRPSPVLVDHVASRVALEVGWLAASLDHADRLDGRMELLDVASPRVREVRFVAHPDCPCGLADRAA